MSKITFSAPSKALSFLTFSVLLAIAGGCSYKDKRDEKNARKAAEISEKIQNENEAERVSLAKSDLQSRISYYEALEGEYQGVQLYSSSASKNFLSRIPKGKMSIRVRISALNIPAEYMQTRVTRESEVLSQLEGMRLMVDVFEGDTELNLVHVTCNANDVKPDFYLGILRFTCPASTSSPARTYNLSLDYSTLDEDMDAYGDNSSEDSIYDEHPLVDIKKDEPREYARSSSVANALLKQRLRKVEIINLEVISPDVTVRGKVWRKSEVR